MHMLRLPISVQVIILSYTSYFESMDGGRPPRKKKWVPRLLMRSRSDHNLSAQSGRTLASAIQVCSPTVLQSSRPFVHDNLQPSLDPSSQPVSNTGRSGLFRNIFKTQNTRSADQSPHLEPVTSSSSTEHSSSDQSNQVAVILTVRMHHVR